MRNVLRLVCLSVSLGLGLCLVAPSLAAVDITLDSPLTTVVPLNGTLPAGGTIFTATCTVPADAPADLGVGAYVTDHHGRWFQRLRPGNLQPGTQSMTIVFNDDEPVTGIDATWDGAQSAAIVHGGLFFWSASAKRTVIGVTDLRAESLAAAISPAGCLAEVQTDHVTATTGERWQVHFRPQPFPQNPYDPAEFTVDLVVTRPDGTTQRIPGFSEMPMLGHDRGDHEEVLPDGRAVFSARWRPSQPGVYHLRLEAHWVSGAKATSELAPVNVGGAPSMPYVSIDPVDPRFFTIAGAPFWPVGPNLRAVTDPRCTERLHTIATPDRGTLAYADFFARLAPHGVNAAELWLSSWNLALEWRGDWPEFAGLGRYSQERAWRLDRILDLAWQNGIRLNLVINNHGQVSEDTDREWQNNPYSRANGGFIDDALQYFIDPRALARQDALRRYIAGRYADHPGVLGWKLWSEQDLTVAGRRDKIDVLATWHAQAAARWGVLDTYHHPLTTHWSGNFRRVFPSVAMLPGIDFLTIDAYHEPFDGSGKGQLLAELLLDSTTRRGGLSARYNKPVLVSEHGGNWDACPATQLEAEHASSGFCALVAGHAGAPMLWWFEWIDQGARFDPYSAVTNFIAGEDLRAPAGQTPGQTLVIEASDTGPAKAKLWCHAWSRSGRLLGYLLDEEWQQDGRAVPVRARTSLHIGDQIKPGPMTLSWWDADTGHELKRHRFTHPGGELNLEAPPWRKHVAFKLWRDEPAEN